MAASAGAGSCVWGSRGDFDSIAAFSDVVHCIACICSSAAADSPAVPELSSDVDRAIRSLVRFWAARC